MALRKKVPYDRVGTDPVLPTGVDPSAVPQMPPAPPYTPPGPLASDTTGQAPDLSSLNPQTPTVPDLGAMAPDQGSALDQMGLQTPPDQTAQGGEDQSIQDMLDAVANPETPPEIRDAINAQIALAARRRLAGAGGL